MVVVILLVNLSQCRGSVSLVSLSLGKWCLCFSGGSGRGLWFSSIWLHSFSPIQFIIPLRRKWSSTSAFLLPSLLPLLPCPTSSWDWNFLAMGNGIWCPILFLTGPRLGSLWGENDDQNGTVRLLYLFGDVLMSGVRSEGIPVGTWSVGSLSSRKWCSLVPAGEDTSRQKSLGWKLEYPLSLFHVHSRVGEMKGS